VKFLCDRCKTRYSIGDERVRGKILKIRCKNCANVITVREGMEADTQDDAARAKKTTGVPAPLSERSTPGDARSPRTLTPVASPSPGSPASPAGPASPGRIGSPASPAAAGRLGSPASVGSAKDPVRGDRPRAGAPPAAEVPRTERSRSALPAEPARTEPADRARAVGSTRRAGASDDASRRPATAAAQASRDEPVSALGAAFASAMAKPPPALDEEWYVSIDGEQAGPYSLAEAQHWVAQRPYDAELHCWSEGFDDWLPVDKVSHFRGLRKRPPPATPPPVPRLGGVAARAPLGSPVEDEPKPLFAATMASLERGAPASQGLSLPPLGGAPRTNGAAPAGVRPGAVFDPSDPADSATELEAARFLDSIPRPGEADAKQDSAPSSSDAALTAPHLPASSARAGAARGSSPVSEAADDFGDDSDLAIGEVSRVVNLGDVTRKRERPGSAQRATPLPGAVGRSAAVGLRPGRAATVGPAAGRAPADGDPGMSIEPVAPSHRRGLIALLSVAIVLVLGVIGAVVLLVTSDDEPFGSQLGTVRDIDTSRPDSPRVPRSVDPADPTTPANPLAPRPPRPRAATSPGEIERETQVLGDPLRGDEVEDVARRYQDSTQRCYMRAQRGVDAILIGDVKKIGVTLTIDTTGNVSDVQLSEHAANNLGKCLTGMLRGWKFRQSPGGTFKFSLNFVGG
jgi:predicted Zn finger-like uncharacterized protein